MLRIIKPGGRIVLMGNQEKAAKTGSFFGKTVSDNELKIVQLPFSKGAIYRPL